MSLSLVTRGALTVLAAVGVAYGVAQTPNPGIDPVPVDVPAQLAALAVAPAGTAPYVGYSWGDWKDLDSDCQNTRHEVLIEQLEQEVLNDAGCLVVSGMFDDPYSGVSGVALTSGLQIDHRVAQADADRSGGNGWSPARKLAFTNDQGNLVATASRINGCKSDKGPAEWSAPPIVGTRVCDRLRAPTDVALLCDYAEGYVATKARWGLSVTAADRDVLAKMLEPC